MPAVKDVGEPCAGEPHARFDGGREETSASRPRPCGARRLPPTRHNLQRAVLIDNSPSERRSLACKKRSAAARRGACGAARVDCLRW